MTRLSAAALRDLPSAVERPRYDRSAVSPGIVHLGIGAFHRAHQAVYVDDRLAAGEADWGIIGASLRSSQTRDALVPQDGLYTLSVRDAAGERLRIVGSLLDVLVAPENRSLLLSRLTDPRTRIVSLTVTEKGYCHDPATGRLDEKHPDIRHDLAEPAAPRSAPGLLVEALARRRSAGVPPFTALSCDNLPSNGKTLNRIVTDFAFLRDPDLARFIKGEVAFPSTMVDRIVPATSEADRARISSLLGVEDAWPVVTEPFTQWVIEDRFPSGRPRLEAAGAELVADVEPYETMKLRLLNGSHSTLAYLGFLAGYGTVAEAMQDETLAGLIRRLMDEEVTPTLAVPPGADLESYKAALIERFRNPALRHRTAQIAMDGSQKLPQRLLGTIRDRLRQGAPIERLALAVAAWMRYVTGRGEDGSPYEVSDPLADRLAHAVSGAAPSVLVERLLQFREIFGDDLPGDPRFRGAVGRHLASLFERGARRTIAAVEGRLGT